jgi:hypothetical protein
MVAKNGTKLGVPPVYNRGSNKSSKKLLDTINLAVEKWSCQIEYTHTGTCSLTAGYGTDSVQVPQLSPSEGFQTLGVFISPSGSTKLAHLHRLN